MSAHRRKGIKSGLVATIEVRSTTGYVIVGSGIIEYFFSKGIWYHEPTIISNNGEPMEPGWYQLRAITEPILAVIPERIQ